MAYNFSYIYLLKYNNYFNKTIKKFDTIEDYITEDKLQYGPFKINFNPADGVDTQQDITINYIANTPAADYAVVVNEDGEIVSRWFIVNATRLRGGQYRLSLRRDLIADNYDKVISAPCFIERAIVNYGDKLIYNAENFVVNQIKQGEQLLRDYSNCPWIVGYLAPNAPIQDKNPISSTTSKVEAPEISDISYEDFQEWITNGLGFINSTSFTFEGYDLPAQGGSRGPNFRVDFGATASVVNVGMKTDYGLAISYIRANQSNLSNEGLEKLQNGWVDHQNGIINEYLTTLEEQTKNVISESVSVHFVDQNFLDAALGQSGLLVKDRNGTQYTVKIKPAGDAYVFANAAIGSEYDLAMVRYLVQKGFLFTGYLNARGDAPFCGVKVNYAKYDVSLERYSGKAFSAEINPAVQGLTDAPYKMFAIPYPIDRTATTLYSLMIGDTEVSGDTIVPNANAGMNLAMQMAQSYGSSLYDLQLVPFCPCREYMYQINEQYGTVVNIKKLFALNDTTGRIQSFEEEGIELDTTKITPIVYNDNGVFRLLTYILWCDKSSFNFPISYSIKVPNTAIDFKVEHETSFCRLNSPNYNGGFEFKPTANNGVDYFEVNATYKPFSPTIEINPKFKGEGLYGGDYNDARGLICGGSFSLPIMTDHWEQYQINNKSYMDSFKNEIENMEVSYNIKREQAKTAATFSAISTGISTGVSTGGAAMLGSGGNLAIAAGTGVATGLVSGILSAEAAKKDLEYADRLQAQSVSHAKEQFEYSLQNIKALPYSLTRVSSYDILNKYFPFIEFFSCSDREKELLKEKIKYTSMSVGAISKISEFLQEEPTFIQGQLIRIEDLAEDYHTAAAIANELNRGIYI